MADGPAIGRGGDFYLRFKELSHFGTVWPTHPTHFSATSRCAGVSSSEGSASGSAALRNRLAADHARRHAASTLLDRAAHSNRIHRTTPFVKREDSSADTLRAPSERAA